MSVFCAAHPDGAPGPCVGCAAARSAGEAPDFSGLAALVPRDASSTWSPTFAIAPDPGTPLADQVFAAARRLREKKAQAEAEATRTMFYAEDNKMTSRMVISITITVAALAVLAAVAAVLIVRFWGQA